MYCGCVETEGVDFLISTCVILFFTPLVSLLFICPLSCALTCSITFGSFKIYSLTIEPSESLVCFIYVASSLNCSASSILTKLPCSSTISYSINFSCCCRNSSL